ncbi:nickel ABC transporter permease [Veillonella sp. CHU110]|uniref:nickel ABC transporter permease n=1 Tax=Veillonella sp. CHU110 TaxID=2490947 RepID=UPI000F8E0F65|nr:nickel ABC transporter permease [Veillonella sp. CHU110]
MKTIVSKVSQLLVTLIGVTFLTFCLTYIAPGDPALMVLEAGDTIVSQEMIDATRKEMGLDRPFMEQYVRWVAGAVQGDLGTSYSGKKAVTEKLSEGLGATALLAVSAFILNVLISIPMGIYSAVKANKLPDFIIRFFAFVNVSMPSFWLGMILLYIFGLKLHWVPIATSTISFKALILPAITLAGVMAAKFTRQVRTVIIEELHQDYVMGARARGMSESQILWKHVLPNALLPLITIMGMGIGWLLAGSAVIEIVFSWPGMGKMAVYAIAMRDYPLIEGFVLWIALAYTVINFLVDISYSILDPRLKARG